MLLMGGIIGFIRSHYYGKTLSKNITNKQAAQSIKNLQYATDMNKRSEGVQCSSPHTAGAPGWGFVLPEPILDVGHSLGRAWQSFAECGQPLAC